MSIERIFDCDGPDCEGQIRTAADFPSSGFIRTYERWPGFDSYLCERLAAEHAAGERLEDRDCDPELAERCDRRSIVEVVDEVESDLHRIDGSLRMAALDVSELVVGHSDRTDEPGVRKLRHGTPGLVKRHAGPIGPVQEVDVEVIAPKALQAGPARLQKARRPVRAVWRA